jgi:two-component system chemotaxis sensor kinase CheA
MPGQVGGNKQAALIVARAQDRLLALRVDRLIGEREVVIRPSPPEIQKLRHLTSAAALGDGRLAFVLSLRVLAERAQAQALQGAAPAQGAKRRILVADDSITTRTLHRQVLEAAGFQVQTASDGEEALRVLRMDGADLLVSDIRMPRMDGLALTRSIRQDGRIRGLPVVLVSSLDSDDDRRRATEAGASAYLTKGAYERGALLDFVKNLLPP